MLTVLTAFSPRSHDMRSILANHSRLARIDRFVWLANGLPNHQAAVLRRAADKVSVPVTLIRCPHILPIARAYNKLLETAHEDPRCEDVIELQDDVLAPEDLVFKLEASEFDIAGSWHQDRELMIHSACGHPYVVFMGVLIRKRVFERLGYHDELFIRGVDAEYGIRGAVEGFTCGYAARVKHLGHTTTGGSNAMVRMIHHQALHFLGWLHERDLLRGRRDPILNLRHETPFAREDFRCGTP